MALDDARATGAIEMREKIARCFEHERDAPGSIKFPALFYTSAAESVREVPIPEEAARRLEASDETQSDVIMRQGSQLAQARAFLEEVRAAWAEYEHGEPSPDHTNDTIAWLTALATLRRLLGDAR